MTPLDLSPPIAVATVINTFAVALLWRGHQAERRTGRMPWWMIATFMVYGFGIAAFAVYRFKLPVTTWLDIFGAAICSEAFGGMVVYLILNAAVFTKGRELHVRLFSAGYAIFALACLLAGLFTGR